MVKTSGLAAGKGVIVAQTVEEACQACDDMIVHRVFGEAGREIVVEEFLDGEEASFFAFIDGNDAVKVGSAQVSELGANAAGAWPASTPGGLPALRRTTRRSGMATPARTLAAWAPTPPPPL